MRLLILKKSEYIVFKINYFKAVSPTREDIYFAQMFLNMKYKTNVYSNYYRVLLFSINYIHYAHPYLLLLPLCTFALISTHITFTYTKKLPGRKDEIFMRF